MNKKTEIEHLGEKINTSDRILLINHIRMDPDAFGSLAAFFLVLEKLGKNVKATNDENPPKEFQFLLARDIIETNLDISKFNPDMIISFDAANTEQLGKSYTQNKELFERKDFFVIDHHFTNPHFGKINIIDIESSSSCELTLEIIKTLNYEKYIDAEIATLLLAGIHTDTNTFYNKNTRPETLESAAFLLEKGARNKEIIFNFFRKKTLEKAKLWGTILSKIQSYKDGLIVGALVKKKEYEQYTIKEQGMKGLLNEFIANIEGSKIAYLLYEIGNNEVKGSLRSNDDDIDVSSICSDFGGGGHKLAAGFTHKGEIKELETILLEKLKKIL